MNDAIQFLAPLPPRGLRRNSETRNDGYRRKLKQEYSAAVYWAWRSAVDGRYDRWSTGRILPLAQVHLTLRWQSVRMTPDLDNVIGNCKALIDALRCQQPQDGVDPKRYWLGLFVNDNPDCLLSVTPEVEKLPPSRRAEDGVFVTIRRAP